MGNSALLSNGKGSNADKVQDSVTSLLVSNKADNVGERSNFKIFLHTRKIKVMHSNKRGECCLHTLVDRQRKRYDNAVDVVVRLHGPTDQAPKLRHLRVLAHVQLDDDPRTPIQQCVKEEFRQHDGVATILMFNCRRASPKHHYNIIEDYGGRGTAHG